MSSNVRTTFALDAAELALELAEALDATDDLTDADDAETLAVLDDDGRGGNGVATGWVWHAINADARTSNARIKNTGLNKFFPVIG
jgi:hypothetical protein